MNQWCRCPVKGTVRNRMRNHKLAQHIGSASWSKFFDMLAYKSVWYGNDVVKIPTMYPSSQNKHIENCTVGHTETV